MTQMTTTPLAPVAEPQEVVERDAEAGVPHGDEEAGGAVLGAVAGAVVGAVFAGPPGAVVGGMLGAASGATLGALDANAKDDAEVVTSEVWRS